MGWNCYTTAGGKIAVYEIKCDMEVSSGKKRREGKLIPPVGTLKGRKTDFLFYRITVPSVGTMEHIQHPVAPLSNNSQMD